MYSYYFFGMFPPLLYLVRDMFRLEKAWKVIDGHEEWLKGRLLDIHKVPEKACP